MSFSDSKFKLGDRAVYTDLVGHAYIGEVIEILHDFNYSRHALDTSYTIELPCGGRIFKAPESKLMTPIEYQANLVNSSVSLSESDLKEYTPAHQLKCICGAHAVKDAGHSDWCNIK